MNQEPSSSTCRAIVVQSKSRSQVCDRGLAIFRAVFPLQNCPVEKFRRFSFFFFNKAGLRFTTPLYLTPPYTLRLAGWQARISLSFESSPGSTSFSLLTSSQTRQSRNRHSLHNTHTFKNNQGWLLLRVLNLVLPLLHVHSLTPHLPLNLLQTKLLD